MRGFSVPVCAARGAVFSSHCLCNILRAISSERRGGDQAGIVGGQKYDAAPDLFRFAEAADRNRRQDTVLKNVFRHRLHHFGVDVTGSDRIDGDADAPAFLCQRLGEANLAGLGGRIIGLPNWPFWPLIEEILMMRPNLRSRMPSITCRVMLNSEPRLVLITSVHCSGFMR